MNRISIILALTISLYACRRIIADHAVERARFLDTFTIKGAGGEHHMETAAAHGANTIRTWAVRGDGNSLKMLDKAHKLRLRVILGVWMPPRPIDAKKHHESDRQFDYAKNRDSHVQTMQRLLNLYDDHPALLMWGLGNEVVLSPEYLKTVNLMSELVHRHNPSRLTCIVCVNASQEGVKMIKEFAPDLDVYGANSYGQGSMNNVSRLLETQWGKKYFFAEYAHHGPWSAPKTASKYPLEFSPADKLKRLRQTLPVFSKYKNCVGGVYFTWGPFKNGTETWFSGLLPENPAEYDHSTHCYLTPFTDELQKYWTGTQVDNHAPVISRVTINNQYGINLSLTAKSVAQIHVDVKDAEDDPLQFKYWIFKTKEQVRGKKVSGPYVGTPDIEINAPANSGEYTLLIYAIDEEGKASSHQVPFIVK